jgi:hypothetical protein
MSYEWSGKLYDYKGKRVTMEMKILGMVSTSLTAAAVENRNRRAIVQKTLNAAKLRTAECCGKLFETKEAKIRHENVTFLYGHR